MVPSDRTRGTGHKLEQRKLQLKMRKNFFPLRVPEPWPRLPREVVESPSLEIFQPPLAAVLCPLLWVTLLGQGAGLGDPILTMLGCCEPKRCWPRVPRGLWLRRGASEAQDTPRHSVHP